MLAKAPLTRIGAAFIVALVVTLGSTSCSPQQSELPEGASPELQLGERIWLQRCASCHGLDGGGGVGPKLSEGTVAERYPDIADQKTVILDGLNNNKMPAFKDILSEEEVDAVVTYSRDAL